MRQAMIFAAGLGTRLKPITDVMPKALVTVGNRPLIDIVMTRLSSFGYDRFVVNVHHFAQQIIDHLRYAEGVRISDESAMLLDTGGGLKKAAPLFWDENEPILIHNVDILDNVDYDWFRRQHCDDEDAVLLVSRRKTKRYLLFDSAMRLMGWTNIDTGEIRSPFPWLRTADVTVCDDFQVVLHPLSSEGAGVRLYAFAFSGIHSFSPRLFRLMDRFPDKFSIIDFYLSVCHRSRIMGCVSNDLRILDVGKIDSLSEAEAFFQ